MAGIDLFSRGNGCMDMGSVGGIEFTWHFAMSIISIVIIDLVLAGDNAVIIAMAVKNLPGKTRTLGILIGSGCAVLLRIACTFVVAHLLAIQYVKLAGGAVIIWIAVKLLVENAEAEELHKEAATLLHALWIIMVADISMSVDNMLAVAAASKGNLFLLIFGLGLSIPFVVFTSSLLSKLMQKYTIIVYIGAALLGKVGGEMMITDPFILNLLHPTKTAEYSVMAFFTAGVLVCARIIIKRQVASARKKMGTLPAEHSKKSY
jgi:YjbE family integral membrane protein